MQPRYPLLLVFAFTWPPGWAHWERLLIVGLFLAPFGILLRGGLANWEDAAWVGLAWFVALNAVVFRHGGWGILGPHYFYDVVRLARRGRSTVMRVLFILALFTGLFFAYLESPHQEYLRINDMAGVAERFAFALFTVQNLAVLILTPAYLGSAIAEERERRTLELLFTTQLRDTQIVLGKYAARTLHVVGFVLAGAPVVSFVQVWGGVDVVLIVGNLAYTILLILSVGSFSLLLSAIIPYMTGAVTTAYLVLVPLCTCCLGALHQFGPLVLQDAGAGAPGANVQDHLWMLAIAHGVATAFFLVLAVLFLRAHLTAVVNVGPSELKAPQRPRPAPAPVVARPAPMLPGHGYQPAAQDVFGIPYALPPVRGNVLLWKERFVGGPSLFWSPVVWVPLLPFLMTGMGLAIFYFAISWSTRSADVQQSRNDWANILRFFYWLFFGLFTLTLAFRAAATVVRERQQQTLEPLLLLPVERRDILIAKWLGCFLRAWPWGALMAGTALLGVGIGVCHPFSAAMLCLAPVPLFAFLAGIGLWVSVTMESVLRAYLVVVLVLVVLIACTMLDLPALSYVEAFRFTPEPATINRPGIALALIAMLAYSLLAAVSWLLALSRFDDRHSQPGK